MIHTMDKEYDGIVIGVGPNGLCLGAYMAKAGQKVVFILLEAEVRTAYMLRDWREQAALTQKELAKRLNISYQAYQRMERPGRSNLTVNTLDRVAEALHRELVIELQ